MAIVKMEAEISTEKMVLIYQSRKASHARKHQPQRLHQTP
jgi:hypothetical protein